VGHGAVRTRRSRAASKIGGLRSHQDPFISTRNEIIKKILSKTENNSGHHLNELTNQHEISASQPLAWIFFDRSLAITHHHRALLCSCNAVTRSAHRVLVSRSQEQVELRVGSALGRLTAKSASSTPSSLIRLLSEKRLLKSSRSEGAGIWPAAIAHAVVRK